MGAILIGKRFYEARQLFADRTDRARTRGRGTARCCRGRARAELIGMLNDVFYFPRLLILDYSVSPARTTRTVDSVVETFLARYRA
jgi:hypothetical protein